MLVWYVAVVVVVTLLV